MTNLLDIKNKLEKYLPELVKKYPIKSLGIFGSYSRGEETEDSDIDLLVEFNGPIGMEVVDLVIELEALLEHKVDLVSKNAVQARMLPYVEKDLVYVAA